MPMRLKMRMTTTLKAGKPCSTPPASLTVSARKPK
jgi:hypothetical protein